MFKFIAPAENRVFALLHEIFSDVAEFSSRESGKGKYVSITVKEMMMNPEEVIDRCRKASAIQGLMVL
jgi:uncharacterized protein